MTQPVTRIAMAVGEFLALALLSLVPPLFLAIDIVILGDDVSETSLTEISQEALLLTSSLLFALGAWKHQTQRGFFILAAGLFGCMFVRELDGLLDNVSKGFWLWPALLVAAASIGSAAIFWRDTVLGPLAAFIDTKPYLHILFGLIVVLVFSRIFGSGALILEHVPGYSQLLKTAIQEGLELFGYIFIAYGSSLLLRHRQKESRQS